MAQRYSREEVQAIVARALRAPSADAVTHDELLSIGRELGIDPGALEAAAREASEESALREAIETERREARRGLVAHAIPFVLVNAALALTNLLVGGAPWFLWSLFGWGIGMLFHARAVFFPDPVAQERRARRRLARERERAEREAQRRAVREGAKQLGAAVEQAVPEILGAVAQAIDRSVQESRRANAPPRDGVRIDVAPPPTTEADRGEGEEAGAARDASRARRTP